MPLLAFLPWLGITINIDPTMADFGPFSLTWHGFFTAVGIVAGVSLSVWLLKRDGVPTEIGQELALVAVPSAIVGARLFFVFEHWDTYSHDIPKIITGITEGGITLYGGLLGGVLGGVIYALWRKWPIAIGLDAAAPGMILGQGIGRIGDLINGEHHATMTDLPWGVRYTNPNTLGQAFDKFGNPAYFHPTAGAYELLGDFLILAILLFVARRFIKIPGWTFCLYMVLYGVMRFVLSYFRIDEQELWSVPIPQWTSAILLGVAFILAGVLLRHPGPITREYAERAWGEEEGEESEPRKKSGQAARA